MRDATGPRVYLPELDGLRFFAFLFVFVHHAFPEYMFPREASGALYLAQIVCRSGSLGVDLFFCLSGFLITKLLLTEKKRQGRISIARFYARRALRIWPLYFAFIALCNLGPWSERFGLGDHTLAFVLFLGNWACCIHGVPDSPAALLWSVSVEEQYYIAWPLLLSRLGTRALIPAAGFMLAVAIGSRVLIAMLDWDHPMTWCGTLSRLDPLAAGIGVACWPRIQACRWSASTRLAIFLGGVGTWLLGTHLWPPYDPPSLSGAILSYPLFSGGAACMLVSVLAPAETPTLPFVRNRIFVFLGRVSYGLYVFHVLALILAYEHVPDALGFYDRFVIVGAGLLITITFALISFFLLERPFLRLKERLAVVPSRPGG